MRCVERRVLLDQGRGSYRGTGFGTAARVILVVYRAIQRDQRVARRLD